MAKTANGFGSAHFGISDVCAVFEACSACSNEGPLFSFEATPFWVMFMVPVLPRAPVHVLHFCAVCGAHLEVSQKKWQQLKRQQLLQEADILQNEDAPAVAAALRRLMDFDDVDIMHQAIKWAENNERAKKSALVQSVVGGAYFRLGAFDSATQHLRNSLKKRSDEQVRELLIDVLLRQDAVAEAWREVRPYLQENNETQLLLARKVVARAEILECTLLNEEQDRIALLEEAHRMGIFELTTLPSLQEESFYPSPATPFKKWLPYATWPIVLLLMTHILLVASFWVGENHEVLLLNGVQSAYDIKIDDTLIHLTPLQVVKTYLSQGEHSLYIVQEGKSTAQTIKIHSGIFSRLFENSLDIINPDKAALLSEKENIYSTATLGKSKNNLRVGELHYHFSNADFILGTPPSTIVIRGEGEVTRRVVMQHLPAQPQVIVKMLSAQLGKASADLWLQQQLRYNPHDERHWQLAFQRLPPPILSALAQKSPFARLHQARLSKGPLAAAAKKRLEKTIAQKKAAHAPITGELYYLLAQYTPSRLEYNALLQKAARAQIPSAYALQELALRAAKEGRIPQAMTQIAKAASSAPGSRSIHQLRLEIAALGGAQADVFAAYQHLQALEPLHIGHLLDLIAFRGSQSAKINSEIQHFLQRSKKAFGTMVAEHHHRVLSAASAYFEGHRELFYEQIKSVPGWSLDAAFAMEDWQKALSILQNGEQGESHLLALLIAALRKNQPEIAHAARLLLQRRSPRMAQWLTQKNMPKVEEVRALPSTISLYAARLLTLSFVHYQKETKDNSRRQIEEIGLFSERFFAFRAPPQHLFEEAFFSNWSALSQSPMP